jgi:hypothetical protein
VRILFVIFFVFIIIFSLYPEDIDNKEVDYRQNSQTYDPDAKGTYTPFFYGKFGYSFLMDENIVLGFELALDKSPLQREWITIKHIFGIDYQYIFNNNDSLLRLTYIYNYFVIGGAGISLFYDINNNGIGVAPQIGINNYIFFIFALNINYRYNILLNNKTRNFHEIVLSLSILLPIYY